MHNPHPHLKSVTRSDYHKPRSPRSYNNMALIPSQTRADFDHQNNEQYIQALIEKLESAQANNEAIDPQWLIDLDFHYTHSVTLDYFRHIPANESLDLWPGRIPKASLVMLSGDLGIGKTHFCLDLAARLTTYDQFPDGQHGQNTPVIMINAKDSPATFLRPTFERSAGILERFYYLNKTPQHIPYSTTVVMRDFNFGSEDMNRLHYLLSRTKAKIVFVDNLASVLSSGPHINDAYINTVMQQLNQLTQEFQTTFLLVCNNPPKSANLGKGNSYIPCRAETSSLMMSFARASLLITKDPEDSAARLFSTVSIKRGTPAPTLRFRLVPYSTTPTISYTHSSYADPPQSYVVHWDSDPIPLSGSELYHFHCTGSPLASINTSHSFSHTPVTSSDSLLKQKILELLTSYAPTPLTAKKLYKLITPITPRPTISQTLYRLYKENRIANPSYGAYTILTPSSENSLSMSNLSNSLPLSTVTQSNSTKSKLKPKPRARHK